MEVDKMKVTKESDSQPSIPIPVIDLSEVNSPSDRPKIVDQVKDAAKTWGFFQVINHGIPLSVQNDTLSAVKAFHELPEEVKARYYDGSQELRCMNHKSNTDTLLIRRLPEDPSELPEILRREVSEWYSRATGVAEVLMELLSEGLGLERGKLKELSFLGTRVFIGHRYPYCPEPDRTDGLDSHTDSNVLTVVMQNEIAGLQVMHEGCWVNVKPEIGGLVVNIGDFLQVVSNGVYKSVTHRVLANPFKESRISIIMFFNPSKWKDGNYHGPLPELLSPEKPAIYRDFTQEEYLAIIQYNKETSKTRLVEKVKI